MAIVSCVQHQLMETIKTSPLFSLQLEEPTEVTHAALVLVGGRNLGTFLDGQLFDLDAPGPVRSQVRFSVLVAFSFGN